jgi:hypothetical protein
MQWPAGQHLPLLHTPPPHEVPHTPQFAASTFVSTQVVPQRVKPVLH